MPTTYTTSSLNQDWSHFTHKVKNSRLSEKKEIIDPEAHRMLSNAYLEIINELEKKYAVTRDPSYEKLVNFKTNKDKPIHRWFDYKQGFSDELVQKLIDYSNLHHDDYVFDPFTGVGTTQVSAQLKGFKSIGTDINPVAILAAKVKTHYYTKKELALIKNTLKSIREKYQVTNKVPKYRKLNDIFTKIQLEQILKIKGFYESIENEHVRGFFKLAYLSIIEPVSNRVKDGNGIKILRTKNAIEKVYDFYEERCEIMLHDLNIATSNKVESNVIEGSLLQNDVYDNVKDFKIGSIIYSPPYANCFDYLEVYKMEVWLGGFVDDYNGFAKYRDIALRSHVNSKFSAVVENTNIKVNTIADFIGTYNIWNKKIPLMLRGYFDDMFKTIYRSYQVSRDDALCAIVVANSGYKGVVIPTDLLLVEMAQAVGYKLDKIIHARDMRASSQQMLELRKKDGLMRESIILLRK